MGLISLRQPHTRKIRLWDRGGLPEERCIRILPPVETSEKRQVRKRIFSYCLKLVRYKSGFIWMPFLSLPLLSYVSFGVGLPAERRNRVPEYRDLKSRNRAYVNRMRSGRTETSA